MNENQHIEQKRIQIPPYADNVGPGLAPLLDDSFHIKVDNGAVTLLGEVRDARAKEQLNAKVTAIAGSHSVENKLVIAQR